MPVVSGSILCRLIGLNGLWLSIGLAPIISIVLIMFYIFVKYGKGKIPFIMEEYGNQSFSFDIRADEQSMIEFRDSVEKLIKKYSELNEQDINRILLICEELPLSLIENNNSGLKIECTDLISDIIQLIFRDDGRLINITDSDMQVTSLRSYLLSQIMTLTQDRINMITTSYNRNILTLYSKEPMEA